MRLLVGYLLGFALLTQSGCATFNSWARTAEDYRREAAAALLAAQAVLDECEKLQEPKPRLCTEAEKLAETVSGLPGVE